MRKMLIALSALVGSCACAEEIAGTVDLDGTGAEYTALTGSGELTNAAAAAAVTINKESGTATFAGNITGNISLVKKGDGEQILTGANTYNGGTRLEGGTLSVTSKSGYGTGLITFANGTLNYTGDAEDTAVNFAFESTGTVSVAEGKYALLATANTLKKGIGKVFVKDGGGRLRLSGIIDTVGTPTRWIIDGGTLEINNIDFFGKHNTTTTNLVIDIREGASFKNVDAAGTHHPVGIIELTGGTFDWQGTTRNDAKWGTTAFKGGIIAHASSMPSYVKIGRWAHLNHVESDTTFTVEDGAVLHLMGDLSDGWSDDAKTQLSGKLTKAGPGELLLYGKSSFTGGFEIQGGKVTLYNDDALGTNVVTLTANTEIHVGAEVYAALPQVAGDYTLTKTGPGALVFDPAIAYMAPIVITEGIAYFDTLDAIPSTVTIADGVTLAFRELTAESYAAALAKYPNLGGILTATDATLAINYETARENLTIGALEGATLTLTSLSGVQNLSLVGNGVVDIAAVSNVGTMTVGKGALAYVPEGANVVSAGGAVFTDDSTETTIPTFQFMKDETIDVPGGRTITVGAFVAASGGKLFSLTKTGDGTLVLPNADHAAVFGELFVNGGTVRVAAESNFGGSGITVTDAEIALGGSWTINSRRVVLKGTSAISVPEGATLNISSESFKTAGATFVKKGAGALYIGDNDKGFRDHVTGARWVIEQGVFTNHAGNCWADYKKNVDFTLKLCEGTEMVTTADHLPFANLELCGATIRSSRYTFPTGTSGSTDLTKGAAQKAFCFNKPVKVTASSNGTPSRIVAAFSNLATEKFTTTFDVAAGAELVLDTALCPGVTADLIPIENQGFSKTGKGTLTFARPSNIDGMIAFDGTIKLSRGAYFPATVKFLPAGADAKIQLEDGAVFASDAAFRNPLLASADIWVDATQMAATHGSTVANIPNYGTAGGSFKKVNADVPTFSTNAINSLAAFSFNGNQGLVLDTYTNTTDKFTIYVIAKWTSWDKAGGKGRWGGPVSFGQSTSPNDDDSWNRGVFMWQFGGETTIQSINTIYGTGASFNITGETLPLVGEPFLLNSTYNAKAATVFAYKGDASEPVAQAANLSEANVNQNVDRVAIGGRFQEYGNLQANGNGNGNNRMMIGDIGEMIVFSRLLTDNEKTVVEAYLKRKWFGSATEPVAATESGEASPLTIEVAADATGAYMGRTATLNDGAANRNPVRKTGAGALNVGAVGGVSTHLVAAEGTLKLENTKLTSQAAVWADAADASTIEFDESGKKVLSLANKGTAGGSFVKNTRADGGRISPNLPDYAKTGLNGRPALSFDGTSALMLNTYTNRGPADLHIYIAVNIAEEWTETGGSGKWGGPVSLSSVNADNDDNVYKHSIHFEKSEFGSLSIYYSERNKSHRLTDRTGGARTVPYIIAYHRVGDGYFAAQIIKDDDVTNVPYIGANYMSGLANPGIDLVQLGGRLSAKGSAIYYGSSGTLSGNNRMWIGHVGELIVFDNHLNSDDEKALLEYLSRKWLDDATTGEVAPPACLTGLNVNPVMGETVSLSLQEGVTVEHAAAVQTVTNLTAETGVTWARPGVTSAGDWTFFNVMGNLALDGTQTLNLTPGLKQDAVMFNYGGACTMSDWTLVGEKSDLFKVRHSEARKTVELRINAGLIIIVK